MCVRHGIPHLRFFLLPYEPFMHARAVGSIEFLISEKILQLSRKGTQLSHHAIYMG